MAADDRIGRGRDLRLTAFASLEPRYFHHPDPVPYFARHNPVRLWRRSALSRAIDCRGGERRWTDLYRTLHRLDLRGYFGAGLRIILLAIAQIIGCSDFHVANSIKNLLATSFTILSIVVVGIGGLITWSEALTMMAGSTLGGYLGGAMQRR